MLINTLGIKSPEETGLSFIKNALLKARHASKQANKPALADDSGLVVDALQGEPDLYSARYAKIGASDAENIDYILKKLAQEIKKTISHRHLDLQHILNLLSPN